MEHDYRKLTLSNSLASSSRASSASLSSFESLLAISDRWVCLRALRSRNDERIRLKLKASIQYGG